jgi:hypothetical protein
VLYYHTIVFTVSVVFCNRGVPYSTCKVVEIVSGGDIVVVNFKFNIGVDLSATPKQNKEQGKNI